MKNMTDFRKTVETGVDPRLTLPFDASVTRFCPVESVDPKQKRFWETAMSEKQVLMLT